MASGGQKSYVIPLHGSEERDERTGKQSLQNHFAKRFGAGKEEKIHKPAQNIDRLRAQKSIKKNPG